LKKVKFLLCLFIAIQIIAAGCGKIPGRDAFVPYNDEAGQRPKSPALDKNTGVISDTVADVFAQPDVKSERITQVIFNQPVRIIEESNSWTRIKISEELTGWVKSRFVEGDVSSISFDGRLCRVVVTAKTKSILSAPRDGLTVKEVVMGTELYSFNKRDNAHEVLLPGKASGWISEGGIIEISLNEKIPKTTVEDFIATAERLKGVCYTQGGISARGIDCTGLIYMCAHINGVDLPLSLEEQYYSGDNVPVHSIKPGDILFFSSKEDASGISEAGIFLHDNQFIYASKLQGYVTLGSLEDEQYLKRLKGVRRIF
jgi:cell wall-associated NlpC family hydrolase